MDVLYQVEEVPVFSLLLVSIVNECWILSNIFLSFDTTLWFFF